MALEVLGGEWKGRIERLERWVKGLRVYGASGFKNDLNSGAAITIPSGGGTSSTQQPTLFPVNLTQVGGGDGTTAAPCSYTYNLTNSSGTTLGTSLSPEFARPNGSFVAATHGWAYYKSGTLTLSLCDEVPNTGPC